MEQEMAEGDSDSIGSEDVESKKIRESLAVIKVPYNPDNQSIIFSYHYKYEKYLRDRNLIDPDKAKQLIEREKRRALVKAKQDGNGSTQPGADGGEDLSAMDEDASYPGAMGSSKHRFD